MNRPGVPRIGLALALICLGSMIGASAARAEISLPPNFEDQTVFEGAEQPVNFKFAPDGKIFVAEKPGKILVYDGLDDKTPTVFANLSKPVYDYEDHGVLGLAIDPMFALGRPYVYALYTFNHTMESPNTEAPLAQEPHKYTPTYPSANVYEGDKCEEAEKVKKKELPEELKGCVVSGVLVKLTADLETDEAVQASPTDHEAKEEVLLYGWCQQATTHSIGEIEFEPGGGLLVSGGEGAMFSKPDFGEFENVCKDPPEPANPLLTRPEAEGGSLRSQSWLRDHTLANHPTLLSGTILRVDPNTGEAWPGNPLMAASEENARRIIGLGFRQPWRFAINRRTNSIYVDNVGNGSYEEMDHFALGASQAYNSGWPCFEGGNGQSLENHEYVHGFGLEVPLRFCEELIEGEKSLINGGVVSAPFFSYPHNGPVTPGDPCAIPSSKGTITSDIGGVDFYEGSGYPAEYRDALFFSDPIRGCIYVMHAGANGEPDPADVTSFLRNTEKFSFPGVQIRQGPEGNIFYSQLFGAGAGTIHRIVYNKPSEPSPRDNGGGGGGSGGSNPPPPPPPTYKPPKISKRPQKTTTSRTGKFVFKAEPGLRFRCKIDGKKFSSCHSPRTYKNLKLGKHSFRVYAADAAGNRLTKNTTFSWKIVKP